MNLPFCRLKALVQHSKLKSEEKYRFFGKANNRIWKELESCCRANQTIKRVKRPEKRGIIKRKLF